MNCSENGRAGVSMSGLQGFPLGPYHDRSVRAKYGASASPFEVKRILKTQGSADMERVLCDG